MYVHPRMSGRCRPGSCNSERLLSLSVFCALLCQLRCDEEEELKIIFPDVSASFGRLSPSSSSPGTTLASLHLDNFISTDDVAQALLLPPPHLPSSSSSPSAPSPSPLDVDLLLFSSSGGLYPLQFPLVFIQFKPHTSRLRDTKTNTRRHGSARPSPPPLSLSFASLLFSLVLTRFAASRLLAYPALAALYLSRPPSSPTEGQLFSSSALLLDLLFSEEELQSFLSAASSSSPSSSSGRSVSERDILQLLHEPEFRRTLVDVHALLETPAELRRFTISTLQSLASKLPREGVKKNLFGGGSGRSVSLGCFPEESRSGGEEKTSSPADDISPSILFMRNWITRLVGISSLPPLAFLRSSLLKHDSLRSPPPPPSPSTKQKKAIEAIETRSTTPVTTAREAAPSLQSRDGESDARYPAKGECPADLTRSNESPASSEGPSRLREDKNSTAVSCHTSAFSSVPTSSFSISSGGSGGAGVFSSSSSLVSQENSPFPKEDEAEATQQRGVEGEGKGAERGGGGEVGRDVERKKIKYPLTLQLCQKILQAKEPSGERQQYPKKARISRESLTLPVREYEGPITEFMRDNDEGGSSVLILQGETGYGHSFHRKKIKGEKEKRVLQGRCLVPLRCLYMHLCTDR